jgi:hypothetical protein
MKNRNYLPPVKVTQHGRYVIHFDVVITYATNRKPLPTIMGSSMDNIILRGNPRSQLNFQVEVTIR